MIPYKLAKLIDRIVRPIGREILRRVELPLPEWYLRKPLADYDFVVECFEKQKLGKLEGDLLELGSWLGFGTAKLAALANKYGKQVHTADWFTIDFRRPEALTAASVRRYCRMYSGLSQRDVFDQNTSEFSNISVHAGDIHKLSFPHTTRFVCSVIDAGHSYNDVQQYLDLAWRHLSPGGLIVLNDYLNPNTPGVTAAADLFVAERHRQVGFQEIHRPRRMLVLVKPWD